MPSAPVFADRSLLFPELSTLVLSDLHLGRDATANVQLPLGERERLQHRVEALLDEHSPTEVVLAGDILHAFDRVPAGVGDQLDAILTAIEGTGATPVLVRGNHDSMLDAVTDHEVRDHYRISEQRVVCHGHEQPDVDAATYIIGHEHPTISVEGQRRACYLVGPGHSNNTKLIVLPAFNTLAPGVDFGGRRTPELQSPMIESLDEYRPGVIDEDDGETLWFPPLESFRQHL